MAKRTECRNCGKVIRYSKIEDHPYLPFCSKRCKMLDLGMWLDGKHRIEVQALDVQATVLKDDADEDRQ